MIAVFAVFNVVLARVVVSGFRFDGSAGARELAPAIAGQFGGDSIERNLVVSVGKIGHNNLRARQVLVDCSV